MRIRKPSPSATPPTPVTHNRSRSWRFLALPVILLSSGGLTWLALRSDPLNPAREALTQRDFSAARALLTSHLERHPDDLEARLLAAQAARREGDFDDAFDHLKRFERTHGSTPSLNHEIQLLQVQLGNITDAETLFSSHIDRPDLAETPIVMEAYIEAKLKALAPRSDLQMDANSAEQAGVDKLHRAVDLWLRLRPGQADQVQGLVWRGRTELFENEHAKGVADLRKALEFDPQHTVARWHLAMAVAQESPPEAAQHLEILLARKKDDYLIRFGLARTYRLLGRTRDARQLFDALRTERPNDPAVLLEIANLSLDRADLETAGPLVTRLLELAPDAPPVILTASRYHQLASRSDEAERYRKRFEQIETDRQKKSATPK